MSVLFRNEVDNTALVAGTVVRDAEYRKVGKNNYSKANFTVAYGENKYVSVAVWFNLAEHAKLLKKGDHVIAFGQFESRDYNGKTYTDLTIGSTHVGKNGFVFSPELAERRMEYKMSHGGQSEAVATEENPAEQFTDITSDDIPF